MEKGKFKKKITDNMLILKARFQNVNKTSKKIVPISLKQDNYWKIFDLQENIIEHNLIRYPTLNSEMYVVLFLFVFFKKRIKNLHQRNYAKKTTKKLQPFWIHFRKSKLGNNSVYTT